MKSGHSEDTVHVKRRHNSSLPSVETIRPCDPAVTAHSKLYEPTVIRSTEVAVVLTVLFTAVAYQGNERYTAANGDSEDSYTDISRLLTILISLCQIIGVLHYHRSRLKIKPPLTRPTFPEQAEKLDRKSVLAEVLLHCVVLPPRVNASWKLFQLGTHATLELSDVVFALGLARIYHVHRAIYWISSYSSRRAMFYCCLEGVEDCQGFIWRSFLKKYILLTFILAWATLNVTGGLALRTFDHSVPGNKVDTLWSAFWSVVVSETTIGYGDAMPLTHIGRLTIIASIALGMAIYAYVIMNTHKGMELNPHQHVLYGAIHYAESYKKQRNPAALLVQRWWKYYRNRALGLPSLGHLAKFNFHIRTFRLMRRKVLSFQTPLLAQAITHFEKEVIKRLSQELSHLSDIQSVENLVTPTQSREISTTWYSVRMKLRSIAHSSKGCKGILAERRESRTSSAGDMFHARSSISSIGSISRNAKLHRARDLALKKLHKVRSNYIRQMTPITPITPDSAKSE